MHISTSKFQNNHHKQKQYHNTEIPKMETHFLRNELALRSFTGSRRTGDHNPERLSLVSTPHTLPIQNHHNQIKTQRLSIKNWIVRS